MALWPRTSRLPGHPHRPGGGAALRMGPRYADTRTSRGDFRDSRIRRPAATFRVRVFRGRLRVFRVSRGRLAYSASPRPWSAAAPDCASAARDIVLAMPGYRGSSMRTRLLLAVLAIVSLLAVFTTRVSRKMPDFQVYRTAGARAIAAEPLYRDDDGHYQFKYLPAFALLAAPLALMPLPVAKAAWFAAVGRADDRPALAQRAAPSRRPAAPGRRAGRDHVPRDGEVLRARARARAGEPAVRRDRR